MATIYDYAAAFRAWCDWFGLPVRITEVTRTTERQSELFKIGRRGVAGEVPVTWTLDSAHIKGRAFDFTVLAPYHSHPRAWELGGLIGEALGMRWGGRWSERKLDLGHLEVPE